MRESNTISCIHTKAIIEYVRRKEPDRIAELFAGLPAPLADRLDVPSFLSDPDNAVPPGILAMLLESARLLTGNPAAAFEIGAQAVSARRRSPGIFGTRAVLRMIRTLDDAFDRGASTEALFSTPGRVVVRRRWKEGGRFSKDLCAYSQGMYSAIPTFWGLPPARPLEYPCFFEDGPYCEVSLSWNPPKGRIMALLARIATPKSRLFDAMDEWDKGRIAVKERIDELSALNRALSGKIMLLKTINETHRALVSGEDAGAILKRAIGPIVDVLGFDHALVMLLDEKGECLEYRFGVGELPQTLQTDGYRVPLAHKDDLMVRVFRKKKPLVVRDARTVTRQAANPILTDFKSASFILCPLVAEDKAIGILGADRGRGRPRPTSEDGEFLSILSASLATTILRGRLDEELKSSYVSSVRALVQAIEEKDTYTRGHSERVAAMAVKIGRALGLPERDIEYLRFGSILHDVGKIGISESIVRSPKSLTDAEFKIIQLHPIKGVEILQPISFIKDHLYLIRNHHERYDGKGYPDRLRGDEIPIGAQIVAVADAFDAMTSSRPYRKGLPFKQAVREIKDKAGTQFSPQIAATFLKVFGDGELMERKAGAV